MISYCFRVPVYAGPILDSFVLQWITRQQYHARVALYFQLLLNVESSEKPMYVCVGMYVYMYDYDYIDIVFFKFLLSNITGRISHQTL
jgi:hypothetical protein